MCKREQPENERGAGLLDDRKYAPKLDVGEGEGGQRMRGLFEVTVSSGCSLPLMISFLASPIAP